MELSNFEVWEKWVMLLTPMVITILVAFRKKPKINFFSEQIDTMYKKIDAGIELRPKTYLR